MKYFITKKLILLALTMLHFSSMLLVVLGIFPTWIIWVHLAAGAVFVLFAGTYFSLIFIIANIPFFAALPCARIETLQIWRVLLAEAGLIFLIRNYRGLIKSRLKFFAWDPYLAAFLAISLISLSYARFPVAGLKQIILWLNIYVLYVLIAACVKSKDQVSGIIKASAFSLAVYGFIGYAQLIATFFTSLDTFWVYWASFISNLFYGQSFSSVLLYSNSWFSYTGGSVDLRMFSVLPDSHSFAWLMVFCIGSLLCLTYMYDRRTIARVRQSDAVLHKNLSIVNKDNRIFGQKVNYWLWLAVRSAGLAIVLSGTRAVWVGLIPPFVLVSFAYWKGYIRPMAKKLFWPFVLILLFFLLSPVINKALHMLQVRKFQENFISRARSIYDLNNEANVSRMVIWEESVHYAVGHPFGAGLGNYVVSLSPDIPEGATYGEVANARNMRFNLPQKFVTAHNLYLHILVEAGVLGLVIFLGFWGIYFYALDRFLRKHRKDNSLYLFFVGQAGIVFLWFLSASLFDVTFFNDKVLIYFFISLALSGVIMKNYDVFITDNK